MIKDTGYFLAYFNFFVIHRKSTINFILLQAN